MELQVYFTASQLAFLEFQEDSSLAQPRKKALVSRAGLQWHGLAGRSSEPPVSAEPVLVYCFSYKTL